MPDINATLAPRAHEAGPKAQSAEPVHSHQATPDLLSSASPPLAATDVPGSEHTIVLAFHGELAEIEAEWKAFERTADCTAFQSFKWLASWQQHIGERNGTLPVVVLGRDQEGQLLFILPLAVETHALVRRLTWLGSSLCDYNAPLLAAAFPARMPAQRFAALWRDIVWLIRADRRLRFDLIDLAKMPPMVGAQRNPFFAIPLIANPSGAYVATLGRTWDDFYAAKRSSATRKKERRQLKNLAEHGAVRFVDVAGAAEIERTLETLFGQKSRAFARMGVEDRLARPGYRAFYLAVASTDDR